MCKKCKETLDIYYEYDNEVNYESPNNDEMSLSIYRYQDYCCDKCDNFVHPNYHIDHEHINPTNLSFNQVLMPLPNVYYYNMPDFVSVDYTTQPPSFPRAELGIMWYSGPPSTRFFFHGIIGRFPLLRDRVEVPITISDGDIMGIATLPYNSDTGLFTTGNNGVALMDGITPIGRVYLAFAFTPGDARIYPNYYLKFRVEI